MADGVDPQRVNLLLAVLEKRAGMHLSASDVFVNIAGGVRIEEPAVDLGIALALASSFRNKPISPVWVAVGEIGLSGEIRSINWIEKRIGEAEKLGFKKAIIAKSNYDKKLIHGGMELFPVNNLSQALEILEIK